jgi:putative ABC transport system permease protein
MLRKYLRVSLRHLKKRPIISAINIGGLGIAIAAVLGISLWLSIEFGFDNFHKNSQNIYLLKAVERQDNSTYIEENTPYPLAQQISARIPAVKIVSQMRRSQPNAITLKINNNQYGQEWVQYIDSNWFKLFDYNFIQGTPALFFNYRYNILLTRSKAKELFGSVNVLGQTVIIDSTTYRVNAVVEDNPANSSFQFDVMIPMGALLDTKSRRADANYWGYSTCKSFVLLNPEAKLGLVQSQISSLLQAQVSNPKDISIELLRLKNLHFASGFMYSAFKHGNIKIVNIFLMLSLILLLIAIVNYVNLTLALMLDRIKEISVRKIIGAKSGDLFAQTFFESVVSATMSLIVSIVILQLCMPLLSSVIPSQISLFTKEFAFIVLTVLILLILINSAYPLLFIRVIKPIDIFRGRNVFGIKTTFLKKGLLIFQFTLAIFITIAAMGVNQQMKFINTINTDIIKKTLFTAQIPGISLPKDYLAADGLLKSIKYELKTFPSIKAIARSDQPSFVDFNSEISGGISWPGKDAGFDPRYISYSADNEIKGIMNLTIVNGRWFNNDNPFDNKNVILNETAVRQFNLRQPVVGMPFNDGHIIGVVKDFFYKGIHEKIGPVVIRTGMPRTYNLLIEPNIGQEIAASQAVYQTWAKYFPGEICHLSSLNNSLEQLYKEDTNTAKFTKFLSLLSVLLSSLGLLGITIFMIQSRKKEIGVRKLLGSSLHEMVFLLNKDSFLLLFISTIIATPMAWLALHYWLENYAYRQTPNIAIFIIGICLSTTLVLFVSILATVRFASANQIANLRTE